MAPVDHLINNNSPSAGEVVSDREHLRYMLFIWMLPVFFIAPLALFSLQEWWQVVASDTVPSLSGSLVLGSWRGGVDIAIAWTAFVQGISWLVYAGCVLLAFYRHRPAMMLVGYAILVSSIFLQWQLPPVLVTMQ